jgi:hypothetical protein
MALVASSEEWAAEVEALAAQLAAGQTWVQRRPTDAHIEVKSLWVLGL